MKKYGLISRLLPILLISLVLGGTAYSWNARRLAGNAMPMPFGIGMSVVLSGSMEPTLSVNDLVFVKEQPSYREDDIIVFQEGSHLVIHRILTIDEEKAVTQGDANNAPDEPIRVSQIKGKLVASIPAVGVLVRFLQTLPGLLLLLGVAIFSMIRSRQQEKAAANDELDEIRKQIEELRRSMDEAEATPAPETQNEIAESDEPPADEPVENAEVTPVTEDSESEDHQHENPSSEEPKNEDPPQGEKENETPSGEQK